MLTNELLQHVKPAFIRPLNPDQRNRSDPDYLEFLHTKMMPSVRTYGIRSPLLVSRLDEEMWQLQAGGTRLHTAMLLNLPTVPVREITVLTICDGLIEQYQENEMRRSFTAMEKAGSWIAMLQARPEWSQADLARATGEKPGTINRVLTVKDTLTYEELKLVLEGIVPFRSAYVLACAFPSTIERGPWMEKAKELTADRLEHDVKAFKGKAQTKKPKSTVLEIDGCTIKLPGNASMDAINAIKAKFGDLVSRAMKNNLPPSALPSLL